MVIKQKPVKATMDQHLEARAILKRLAATFKGIRNRELSDKIGIPTDYVSFARNMTLTPDGKPQCAGWAIMRILNWAKK